MVSYEHHCNATGMFGESALDYHRYEFVTSESPTLVGTVSYNPRNAWLLREASIYKSPADFDSGGLECIGDGIWFEF